MTVERQMTRENQQIEKGGISDMTTEQKTKSQHEERRRLETLWWAAVLVWAGLIFAAERLDVLPQIGEADAWAWIFFGAGAFGLLGAFVRVASPGIPNPTAWDYFWSGLFLIIGVGGATSVDIFWPLALVLVGMVALGDRLLRRD
jgi:hypothetical protein